MSRQGRRPASRHLGRPLLLLLRLLLLSLLLLLQLLLPFVQTVEIETQ
jgi:hypothetical protein